MKLKKSKNPDSITIDVICCARCGKNHKQLKFLKLLRESYYSHWAPCPTNKEPIMLTVTSFTQNKSRSAGKKSKQ